MRYIEKTYLCVMLNLSGKWVVFFALSLGFLNLNGQESTGYRTNALMFVPAYSFQIPAGDISKRFGANSSVGAAVMYKFRNNWIVGIESSFLFGTKVKENNILDSILTKDNFLITADGFLSEFALFERGMNVYGKFGKIISLSSSNPNSGIMLLAGAGFLKHKIFLDMNERDFPFLSDDYKRGYDRMTNGFSISQFVGYTFINQDKFVNFYAGIEVIEGFTKMRRNWIFDLNKTDTSAKFDLLFSIKIGWIIPKFTQSQDEFSY